jgi:hypothetical protein
MAKQIRPYISDEAYEALVALCKEGGWRQADVVSAALVRMREGENAPQRMDIIQTQLQYVLMTLQHICEINGWAMPEEPHKQEPLGPEPGADAPPAGRSDNGVPPNPVPALTAFYHMTEADFGPEEGPGVPVQPQRKRGIVHKLLFKDSR